MKTVITLSRLDDITPGDEIAITLTGNSQLDDEAVVVELGGKRITVSTDDLLKAAQRLSV